MGVGGAQRADTPGIRPLVEQPRSTTVESRPPGRAAQTRVAEPSLPPRQAATPRGPAVTPPRPSATATPVTQPIVAPLERTSSPDMQRLAGQVVERLANNDARGALNLVYNQRKPGDDDFRGRFMATFLVQSRSVPGGGENLLRRMTGAESTMFNAYLNHGTSRPEDIAYLAVDGMGSNARAINDTYADLARRFPNRVDYDREVRAMDQHYLDTYGEARGRPGSLDADLTSGVISELSGAETREYRAARAQTPAALDLYQAYAARTFGHDGESLLRTLADNVRRVDQFGSEYGYVADGRQNQGRAPLDALVHRLSGNEAERARALIEPGRTPEQRAARYAEATLRGYMSGDVSRDATTAALRSVSTGQNPPLSGSAAAGMDATLLQSVESRARDREVASAVNELRFGGPSNGPGATVDEFERRFTERGGIPELRSFVGYLDGLNGEQRQAILAANPNIAQRINERYAPPEIRQRVLQAVRGETDAVDMLRYSQQGLAESRDVVNGVTRLSPSDRADFRQIYEQRFPGQSFDRAINNLDSEDAAAVRLTLAGPRNGQSQSLETAMRDVRGVMSRERGDSGWAGASRWIVDQCGGRSGPVVDDAFRDLQRAMQGAINANRSGRLTTREIDGITNAQARLTQSLRSYNRDRSDIADNIAMVTVTAATIATLGGAGLTLGTLAAAAGVGGATNASTRALVVGPNTTMSAATHDFLTTAGLEIVTGPLAAPVSGLLGRALRRAVVH